MPRLKDTLEALDESKQRRLDMAAEQAEKMAGVNRYWGGTSTNASRAQDRAEWAQKLEGIEKKKMQENILEANKYNAELANPMGLLSGQERRMELFKDIANKRAAEPLALQSAQAGIDYMKAFTDKEYPTTPLTPKQATPASLPPGLQQFDPKSQPAMPVYAGDTTPIITNPSPIPEPLPSEPFKKITPGRALGNFISNIGIDMSLPSNMTRDSGEGFTPIPNERYTKTKKGLDWVFGN